MIKNIKIILIAITFLILFISICGCLQPDINIQMLEMEIHNLINEERQKNGLLPLAHDSELANIARCHSQDMIDRNFFDHYNPDGQGPTERAIEAGYNCYKDYGGYYTDGIAENICMDNLLESGNSICFIPLNDWKDQSELANSIVICWMESYGHRQNILDSNYDKEGIGVAIALNDEVYVTQDFW